MVKINKHIEIVRAGIPRFSSMGLKSCDALVDILSRVYERVEVSTVIHPSDIVLVKDKSPDVVFLGFKNMAIDSLVRDDLGLIWASDIFDKLDINYTGSKRSAIELDHNKNLAKNIIRAAGLDTADFFLATPGEYQDELDLPIGFPLFIKPPKEGGGSGIDDDSIVRDMCSFRRKVKTISDKFHTPALCEKYLTGREFSIAVIAGGKLGSLIAMPVEIIASQNKNGDRILSQKIKADDVEQVAAVAEPVLKELLSVFAKKAFTALGARDYGRIDIRMDEHGKPHFLEANLIPGLAKHDFTSYFIAAGEINEQITHSDMVLKIVEIALERSKTKILNEISSSEVQELIARS